MHTITILHVSDCAGGRAAMEVASGLARTRPDIRVEDIVIASEQDGSARGFRGSPTVLVDGEDVELDPQTPLGSMG